MYIVLPIILVVGLQQSLGFIVMNMNHNEEYGLKNYPFLKGSAIIPLGSMTPDTNGVNKDEHDVVVDVWQQLNDNYGPHINVYTATGIYASIGKLKTYLSTTRMTHVSAHGKYSNSNGPQIILADGTLNWKTIGKWHLYSPQCKLLVLSACNSGGHDNVADHSLAQMIAEKSKVDMVVDYRDVVDAYSVIYFVHKFWWFMVSSRQPYGGFDAATSFRLAKNALQSHLDTIEQLGGKSVAALLALVGGEFAGPVGAVVGAILGELLEDGIAALTYGPWLDLQRQTLNALDYYLKPGASAPILSWKGSGDPGHVIMPH